MINGNITQERVADAYLSGLLEQGIEYVFANAGTDFAPIVEALAEANKSGRKVPRFVTVPHENLAMAMANGYYRISGKPAAVMVHTTPGTANALCGLMNAAKDYVPVLLAAGRTPLTETGFAESRNMPIHWGQENFDQGSMVREYVKWDYELRSGQCVESVLGRALDIAMSEPRGPVYLSLPREVLGGTVTADSRDPDSRTLGNIPAEPSAKAIQEAAELITKAKFPLIITSTSGRNSATVGHLAALANDFDIAVVQPGTQDMNLPSDHPMHLGYQAGPFLEKADVIVVIDSDIPWIPRTVSPAPGAKVIHIAADPLYSRYPIRGFQMDLPIAGSSAVAVPMLHSALASLVKDKNQSKHRRAEIEAAHQKRYDQRETDFTEAAAQTYVHPLLITQSLNELKSEDSIVINEIGLGIDPSYLDLTMPGTYLSGGTASGLGFGIGAALGAKLAAGSRDVIAVVGDGSYMFGNPIPCHFVARTENLPTLTIVANNSSWHAVHKSTVGIYPDGAAAHANTRTLTDLTPSPSFEKAIETSDGFGQRVDHPEDLHAAIKRGLEAVRDGTPALINVITKGRV